jgi:hypothetical protein
MPLDWGRQYPRIVLNSYVYPKYSRRWRVWDLTARAGCAPSPRAGPRGTGPEVVEPTAQHLCEVPEPPEGLTVQVGLDPLTAGLAHRRKSPDR